MTSRKWILLRGLGRSQVHWAGFQTQLQQAFPQDQVETWDLAGNGTEAHRRSFLNISEYAEDLANRIRSKEPVSVLALSMGAMVATEWARLKPELVQNLILINTSDGATSAFYERLKTKNYWKFARLISQFRNRQAFEKGILKITAPDFSIPEDLLQRFLNASPTTVSNWLSQLTASASFQFPVKAPVQKTLLLSARKDQLVSWRCSERIAQKWQSKYLEHPAGCHDLPLTDGAWIVQQLKEHL